MLTQKPVKGFLQRNFEAQRFALETREAECEGTRCSRLALTLRQAFAKLELAANLVLATG